MPTVTKHRKWDKHFVRAHEGHIKAACYGAASWKEPDRPTEGEFTYHVTGVPQSERDEDTNEDGWWCENCCRERGWLW